MIYLVELLIGLLNFALEGILLYAYSVHYLAPRIALIIHGLIVGTLLLWLAFWHKNRWDLRWPVTICILTSILGVLGAGIAFLSLFVFGFYNRSQTPFLQWLSALFPENKETTAVDLFQRILSGWDDFSDKRRILTFHDILALGTIQQKREALAKISRYYKREFASALQKAIHDTSNAIRVQAATVIANIEQEYQSKYMRLFRQHQSEPTSMQVLLKLAQQTDAFANCGILEKDREQEYRDRAIGYYETYLAENVNNLDAGFALGRLYIYNHRFDKAQELLKACIESDNFVSPNLGMWYLESLYYHGDYSELRSVATRYLEQIQSREQTSPLILDALQLWSKGIPAEILQMRKDEQP